MGLAEGWAGPQKQLEANGGNVHIIKQGKIN